MNALPLAQRYEQFRDDVFGGISESSLPGWQEPMTELQVQSLWFAGEFGNSFTSEDRQHIVIRDFGEWNSGPGPDFTHCTVLIDGVAHTGDIEVDPDVRDWDRHQHGSNETFNRVVLHLFLEAPAQQRAFTRTSQHREVPQVRLTPAMLVGSFQKPFALAPARLGRCATPLSQMPESAVRSLLESAAQHRLHIKSRRLHQRVLAQGRDQAIYTALAQTLGYKQNQRPFTLLTQRLTLRRLLPMKPLEREAMLFGVAGFVGGTAFDQSTDDTRAYLRSLWEHWWKCRDQFSRWLVNDSAMKWSLSTTRPGNHPQRRLGALAALLNGWSKVSAPLKHPGAWNRERWTEMLLALRHDYWSLHYTLTAAPAKKPVALIGETRVHEMLANVVYPLLVPEQPSLWQHYLDLPAMLDNQKVRRASLRLFGDSALASIFQRKLHHQQGLIQIYEDFCLEDDSACEACPFPERLAQWR